MDEEKVKAMIAAAVAPLNERLDKAQLEVSEWKNKFSAEETKRIDAESKLKEIDSRTKARETEDRKEKVRMAREGAKKLLEDAVKAKHITPAQRDSAIAMFGVEDDEQVLKFDTEKVSAFFDLEAKKKADTAKFNRKDESEANGSGDDEEGERKHKDVFEEVDHRVRKFRMTNPKLSFKEATHSVFSADPKLHTEYLNTDPPMRRKVANGGDA